MKNIFFTSFLFLSCLPTLKENANSQSDKTNSITLNNSEVQTIGQYLGQTTQEAKTINNLLEDFNINNAGSSGISLVNGILNILKNTFDSWNSVKYPLFSMIKIDGSNIYIPVHGATKVGNDIKVFLLYTSSDENIYVGPLTQGTDGINLYAAEPRKILGKTNLIIFTFRNISTIPDKLYVYKGDGDELKEYIKSNNYEGFKNKSELLDL